MSLCLVWGENINPLPPGHSPGVSFSLWSEALGQQWLKWKPEQIPDLSAYDTFFVNLFHTGDSIHAAQIRQRYPGATIIVSPDPSLDLVLEHWEWMNMFDQMTVADLIACRTRTECQMYGTLLNKPTFYLGTVAGTDDFFTTIRENAHKEEYIFTLDHPLSPSNTAPNVAALAAVQRATGLRVVYAAQRDFTPSYAKYAGLEAEFLGYVDLKRFAELTANARLAIDMYTRHTIGRFQIMCGLVGTPVIASAWCEHTPGVLFDPYRDPSVITQVAVDLLNNESMYQAMVRDGWGMAQEFNYDAAKMRFKRMLDAVKVRPAL